MKSRGVTQRDPGEEGWKDAGWSFFLSGGNKDDSSPEWEKSRRTE